MASLAGARRPAPLRLPRLALAVPGETALVVALCAVALVAHGLNMFNFPAYARFDDEGIYAAQAWAVLHVQKLAFYTYFYDHAPAGWIFLAAWMGLTGGPFTFGNPVDSGRVFVLLLHLAMVPLLYRIARKLDCPPPAAALVAGLFSLSPLAIYYQRLVLLDNIMLFWVLLSLDLLLDGWGRLSRIVLSGVCFGIALLSKETAVFLAPAMLFVALQQRWRHQGRFGVGGWLLATGLVVSFYPLYAAFKEELLPAGSSLAFQIFNITPEREHVSLVEALQWQASRKGGGMLNLDNQFWQLVRTSWLPHDAVLVGAGAVAVGLNLLRGLRDRRAMAAGLFGGLLLFYLARGGLVFDFYVIGIIPFLCLNLGVLVAPLLRRLPLPAGGTIVVVALGVLTWQQWAIGRLPELYTEDPGQAQRQAIPWIKQHLPAQSAIIIYDTPWVELQTAGPTGPAFPRAHSHWKVALDPAIRSGVFLDDWRTVDYLLTTSAQVMPQAFKDVGNVVADQALQNASLVRRWEADGESVELWKVNRPGATEAALLAAAQAHLTARFERQGAMVRPDGTVASESQAYAMLRAVWSNDRAAFDRTWGWTQANLLNGKGLLSWLWKDGRVVDAHAAADADTDTALALLMAGKRWNDPALVEAGQRMVRAIWANEVVTVAERPHLVAGDWATEGPVVAVNPSYFSPYAYRIFKEADPEHDWYTLLDSGYDVLFASSRATLGAERSAGLPPDWVGLDRATGEPRPLRLESDDTTGYGFDAARTYWRVALDQRWTGDGRAQAFLSQAGFLRDEVEHKGEVSAVYARDGTIEERTPSVVGQAGALAALLTLDPAQAHRLYTSRFVGGAVYVPNGPDGAGGQRQRAYWTNPDDLYAQDWGWFATALYADALPNLWNA